VNGAIRSIGTISLLAPDEIQLQLNQSVTSADVVSLDYTDASALNDAAGVVQDPSGNDMASFSNQPVTNLTAAGLGPALSNINVSGSTVTLVFATPLAATVPDVARFSVLVNGLARQVVSSAVSTTTNTVSLTLISAPTATERLTLSYTDKSSLDDTTGVIQTTAGVDLGDIANRPADTYISSSTVAALNTIYTTLNLIGTAAIQGTANSNNNRISGNGAANQLNGGAGNDSLAGNLGNDTLLGGAGDDSLDGGAGTDTASYAGSALAVRVDLSVIGAQNTQGDGFDTLVAIENLNGSPFNDFLTGNTGNNAINGGPGADEMSGGRGNDTYVVDNAGDTVIEFFNQGTDLVQSSITFILDLNGTENLTLTGTAAINGDGNTLNNAIIGNSGRNILRGFDGNDVLNAAAGDDDLIGGNGNDQLLGGAGNDLIDGGPGVDTASYAGISAGVTVALGVVGAQATGGGGTDTLIGIECLTGSSFHDNLTGDGLANTLSGGAGQDTLDGGEGNDLLIGGAGADLLTGGLGTNTFRFALTDSLLASMDTITDLVVGVDVIDGPRAVSAANLAEIAGSVATLSQADIAAKLTATAFPALGAATFTFAPVGSAVRTFLALNDATAGFDSLRDAVIELKPYYGSLTALAVV
jgi:Ca2+-binding RTX toxin-like protein